ncbi:MAG: hypothetical protein DWQ40_04190 [Actinobacteria bacterium]|nr:MAG: hypothetical protein DWQ40_04190 [Actinomycetota bacterium]REK41030.1 MAG: hypothetical protein DWQ20_00530 [Actinomycetota bacterium]
MIPATPGGSIVPALIIAGFAFGMVALSRWLRRVDRSGYPSSQSEGEESHPEPGPHYRPLEAPPSPPFD